MAAMSPNISSNTSVPFHQEISWVTVSSAILVTINLICNTLVCVVVLRHKQMRTPMNYLLVNLAISDVTVAVFIAPQFVLRHAFLHPESTAGDMLCKLVTGGSFIWIGSAASSYTLVVIAVERYLAISRPSLGAITARRLKAILFTCWLYAVLVNLPLFFVLHFKKLPNDDFQCPENWHNMEIYGNLYTPFCFAIFGVIPLTTMAFFYSLTIRALWKNRLRATQNSDRLIIQQRRKATKMVLIVSVLYAACRMPNLIMYMLLGYKEKELYASVPYVVSVLLVCLNSTMNPFVYSLHSSRFREGVKRLVYCGRYGQGDLDRH